MQNNPLANVIHQMFECDVMSQSYYLPDNSYKREERAEKYLQEVNKFFYQSGLPTFDFSDMKIDENKLIYFGLQLNKYIRDAQPELSRLERKYANDEDIISLYRASAQYAVSCTGKVKNNKFKFADYHPYYFWQVTKPEDLLHSEYNIAQSPNPKRKSLILSMPYNIKVNQEELQKWTYNNIHDLLDNKNIFGAEVDVYVSHFSIEQPRSEKFYLALNTAKNNLDFITPEDRTFVKEHLLDFIGHDLKIDNKGQVQSGKKYSFQELKSNMGNLSILTYCGGFYSAHRWMNEMERIALQLYKPEEVKDALQQIFFINYASLPLSATPKYSGAYFMSNYAQDDGRREPYLKMFRPQVYEHVKYKENSLPARITEMPDKNSFIIAFKLADDLSIIHNKEEIRHIDNQENGHYISFATAPNLASADNFPYNQFRTVLENVALGKRGIHIFDIRDTKNSNQINNMIGVLCKKQEYDRQ